jgi:hypothetical protein
MQWFDELTYYSRASIPTTRTFATRPRLYIRSMADSNIFAEPDTGASGLLAT